VLHGPSAAKCLAVSWVDMSEVTSCKEVSWDRGRTYALTGASKGILSRVWILGLAI
jgi:hypothetical protein